MHARSPFLEFNGFTASLYQRDALAALASVPSESVDLIVTSPPYCIGKEYEKTVRIEDFSAEIERLAKQLDRVLKKGGSICWQVGYHVKDNLVSPLDFEIHAIMKRLPDMRLRNRIIWHFGHGTHSKRRFSGRHEMVLWYSKGDEYYYSLDEVRIPQKYPGKKHYKGPKKGEYSGNPLGKNPEDVWIIPNVKARHPEKTAHPCQFPVALVQRLVRSLCPPGGTVYDPYFGSGSTAVAALANGRNFAGSELDIGYVEIARDRIVALATGTAQVRPDAPVSQPNSRDSVAQAPAHFRGFNTANG